MEFWEIIVVELGKIVLNSITSVSIYMQFDVGCLICMQFVSIFLVVFGFGSIFILILGLGGRIDGVVELSFCNLLLSVFLGFLV